MPFTSAPTPGTQFHVARPGAHDQTVGGHLLKPQMSVLRDFVIVPAEIILLRELFQVLHCFSRNYAVAKFLTLK